MAQKKNSKKVTKKRVPTKKKASRKKSVPKKKGKGEGDSVRKAFKKAGDYVKNPKKLKSLFEEAREKASTIDTGPFNETWAYLLAMIRLIRAYGKGDYREVPWQSMVMIVGSVVYFVSPLDLVPDFLPGGLVDDAGVVALALRTVKSDLDRFMAWEAEEL